jgi:hypothetical protein
MSLLARVALAYCLATAFVPQALARDVVTPPPVQALVPFTSDEGLARLARAVATYPPAAHKPPRRARWHSLFRGQL